MLYWTPTEVRAYLRRWTVFKALIACLMMVAPSFAAAASLVAQLGFAQNTFMFFWYVLSGVVWLWGCADYARSKGYPWTWGLICAPLPLGPFGLIVLFLLPDRWDPRHKDWRFEAEPLLIDGKRMRSARDARIMLKSSWVAKLSAVGAMWLIVAAIWFFGRNAVSKGTAETLDIVAMTLTFTACFLGIWGAAHLARYKGYSPFWAASGFVVLPVALGMALSAGSSDIGIVALVLVAFLLGPVALLMMPDQWHDIGVSPMEYNPNELRDLAPEVAFVESHNVRILNPY